MQIMQISDLHIGDHNAHLMTDLKRRVASLKPDVIIVTGDLVKSPLPEHFLTAQNFLTELSLLSRKPETGESLRPNLIVVPGNHDIFRGGVGLRFLRGATKYDKFFKGGAKHYFYRPEGVWIFGFDSATKGKYAGGNVRDRDIELFHKTYDELDTAYGSEFRRAFKIVALHHHPIPVNWDTNWKHRWLTLLNGGSFLAAVLHRGIDLVLHGHEHLQAHARLRSTLGGRRSGELVVFSLGATLRTVKHPDCNWFNWITVEADTEVRIESYASQSQFVFAKDSTQCLVIPAANALDKGFVDWRSTSGFVYPSVASITLLTIDGDARRIVECELNILSAETIRAKGHEVELPYTSGDIQAIDAKGGIRGGLAGITITPVVPLKATHRNHSLRAIIDFGKALAAGQTVTYQYSWWAVDGFAMNEEQYECKYYADRTNVEFTHFVVEDPVENLLLMVQFPEGFVPSDGPEIRVAKPKRSRSGAHAWERIGSVEKQLGDAAALRFTESMRIASLRVNRPRVGLSYGIQWRVPASVSHTDTFERRQVGQVAELLLKSRHALSDKQAKVLLTLLLRIAHSTREILLTYDEGGEARKWKKPLEVSFLVFDAARKKLMAVKAACFVRTGEKEQIQHELSHLDVMYDYGDGVAGRSFKANDYRLYVRSPDNSKSPNYHRSLSGHVDPWVTLALPIRVPSEAERPYGVLNLNSDSSDCPLARLGESNSPVSEEDLLGFTEEMNASIFRELTTMLLGNS